MDDRNLKKNVGKFYLKIWIVVRDMKVLVHCVQIVWSAVTEWQVLIKFKKNIFLNCNKHYRITDSILLRRSKQSSVSILLYKTKLKAYFSVFSTVLFLSDSKWCSPSGGSIYWIEGYLRILDKLVLQIFLCVEINLRSTQAVNRILVRLVTNYWDQTTTSTV